MGVINVGSPGLPVIVKGRHEPGGHIVIRYEPDQYGRMKQVEHGSWVTYAACQQAIIEALEAERSPRRGYKQYEVGNMMLAEMEKQKATSQEGQHGSR